MPSVFAIDEIYAFLNPVKYFLQNFDNLKMLLRPSIYGLEDVSNSRGQLNAIESGVPATENI